MILEKPIVEMTRHIRPLYVRAHFNGKPMSKLLVDDGSIVNVMPLRMLKALGRGIGDLIEIEVSVSTFIGEISKTLGILPIDITVGSKNSLSTFFVINTTANYNALLGRDYIHANSRVPSFFHQFLLFWKGDEVEVEWADKQPCIATSNFVETSYHNQEFGPIKFNGKKKNGALREIYMELRDIDEIQVQAAKLIKATIIMPFMLINGSIIKEIND